MRRGTAWVFGFVGLVVAVAGGIGGLSAAAGTGGDDSIGGVVQQWMRNRTNKPRSLEEPLKCPGIGEHGKTRNVTSRKDLLDALLPKVIHHDRDDTIVKVMKTEFLEVPISRPFLSPPPFFLTPNPQCFWGDQARMCLHRQVVQDSEG